jgi:hypothetical protein
LLLALAAFQAALAFGAPWGDLAWGGEHEGRLPPRQATGSALIAPFLVAMAAILLMREGWLFPDAAREMVWPVWAVFLFLVTQLFGALRSQSRREKRFMTPVYLVATALTAMLAFGSAG